MATRLSKQSCLPPVTCCFSEYAAFLDPQSAQRKRSNGDDAPVANQSPVEPQKAQRQAFVYRRSMDPQFFQTEELQAKLQKYGEACETLLLQDWLFEISETDESHICKVVLSCSAFLTGPPQLRHEFREFCTNVLLNLRQVLSNQWMDQMASAGVGPTSMLSRRPWSRRAGGAAQPSRCGVCSTGFSLLKKRHICGSCGVMMCSRCVTKSETPRGSQRGATLDINSRRVTKECILCSQFGADGGLSRVSVSIRRHFSGSFHSMSSLTAPTSTKSTASVSHDEVLSSDEEDNNEDVVTVEDVENLDDLSATTGSQEQQQPETEEQVAKRKAARVRSSTEDNTQSWRQPDPELPPVDARTSRTGKARCGSLNLPSSTAREGIVLLTDIETLSLTGSFHRLSTSSHTSTTSNFSSRDSVTVDRKTVARRSPPLPGLRRPVRSVSEGLATKSPAHPTTEYNDDDLANFSLRLS
ncbi:hypothetical protein PINS_up012706 [Pythium insidiosum]|nr:hypothetical protein PINS_up012706 [Pythium insidiosum]